MPDIDPLKVAQDALAAHQTIADNAVREARELIKQQKELGIDTAPWENLLKSFVTGPNERAIAAIDERLEAVERTKAELLAARAALTESGAHSAEPLDQ